MNTTVVKRAFSIAIIGSWKYSAIYSRDKVCETIYRDYLSTLVMHQGKKNKMVLAVKSFSSKKDKVVCSCEMHCEAYLCGHNVFVFS